MPSWRLHATLVRLLVAGPSATAAVAATNVVPLDGDGLAVGPELVGGTDPLSTDTDGDTLLDGWEVDGKTDAGTSLPDADPRAKVLYAIVYVPPGETGIRVDGPVEHYFSRMPIENADGTRGIDLHIGQESIEAEVTFTGTASTTSKRNTWSG